MAGEKVGLSIGHHEDTWEETGGKGLANDGTGRRWEEFWFNNEVGKHAYTRLKEHGFDVVLPQTWDGVGRSLKYRADMFDREKTKLNVSIHANAGPPTAKGACIFYWHNSAGGKKFADIWLKNFKQLCPEQGVHGTGQHKSKVGEWTDFYIIRETDAVTDLIEHGFFTNTTQLKNLKSPDFQKRCAEVIVKSVCEYFSVTYKASNSDPHAWKYEGVNYLHKNNLLNDLVGWSNKIDEDMPVWAVTLILANVHRDLKK